MESYYKQGLKMRFQGKEGKRCVICITVKKLKSPATGTLTAPGEIIVVRIDIS